MLIDFFLCPVECVIMKQLEPPFATYKSVYFLIKLE